MQTPPRFPQSPDVPTLMVFGHPAHELALFGAIQRLDPDILIVTDGGGPERQDYSRRALERIGMVERTRFLGFREQDFYRALLDADTDYFDAVVAKIRGEIERLQPRQIFCDGVEYYNPVHDITIVLVQAALPEGAEIDIFQVPLVYQEDSGDGESYAIQRVPEPLAHRRAVLELDPEEVALKRWARDEVYVNLRDQAGGDFMGLSDEHMAREEVLSSASMEPGPGRDGRRLRYEWRARKLRDSGELERVIGFEEHFRPMVENYLG
ncbi:MAG: hypothetical protein R3190_13610 [Thermoanaerobaculia bacterium]|nr:hypothetical protein [Thermoanaerobaculia bacterium]